MKSKILGLAVVPLLGAASLVVVPSCGQPGINCQTGHGGYAVVYTLKAGSKQGTGTCDQLTAEIIGLEKYNPAVKGDPMTQDLEHATIALRSSTVGELSDEIITTPMAPSVDLSHIDAQGAFTSVDPDAKDVCTIPTLTTETITVPAFDLKVSCCTDSSCPMQTPCPDIASCVMNDCQQPAISVKYAFSNVRVWVTTAYEGVIFAGDLTYTDATQGCSASYTMLGLYPLAACSTDFDCNPIPDMDAGQVVGSGINPDFASNIRCDKAFGYCVLKAPPDNLK